MQFKKKCICIIYAYHCTYEKNNVVNVVKNRHFYTNLFFSIHTCMTLERY